MKVLFVIAIAFQLGQSYRFNHLKITESINDAIQRNKYLLGPQEAVS
jgi:hypothetical protein